jgi:hypothetical protein
MRAVLVESDMKDKQDSCHQNNIRIDFITILIQNQIKQLTPKTNQNDYSIYYIPLK